MEDQKPKLVSENKTTDEGEKDRVKDISYRHYYNLLKFNAALSLAAALMLQNEET